MAKVKISDVAREAGVSLGTVSNALNHPEKLRPETLKLINETINRLGYLPNQSARQLAGGATKSFGLVLPRLDHGFSLQIASGAHNEARKHGYDLLIANADNDDILQDHYLRYFMGTQMSGVMVQPMASPDWHPAMTKMPVPIVHLDIHCSAPGYYVAVDNEAQGRIIAELAIARGAHHIVVVGRAAFMPCASMAFIRRSPCTPISRSKSSTPANGIPQPTATASVPKSPSAPRTNVPILSSA